MPLLLLLGAILALGVVRPGAGPQVADAEEGRFRLVFHDDPSDELFGSLSLAGLAPATLERLERLELDRRAWSRFVSLRVADAPDAAPPILAEHAVTGGRLLLRPRFLPRAGLELVALFDGARLAELLDLEGGSLPVIEQRLVMPAPGLDPSTVVEEVFPSSPDVPENLLRLYVHFSAPMRAADVMRHIHLYDSRGGEVELPFVEVGPGLWDPEQRRLTLFFHPGRIKRGVGPHLSLGPPLRTGESFTLVVDREMRDARGLPLAAPYRRTFVVGPPDRDSPDPRSWTIEPPRGATDPLVLELDEPLDHALLHRLITVRRANGERVTGSVGVSRGERSWSLLPRRAWEEGDYRLEVSPALEDRAGNTPAALFDTPTGGSAGGNRAAAPAEPVRIPFAIRFPPGG